MVCKNCGKELAENIKFCDSCGTTVDNTLATPKKKKSKTWIILLAPIVIFLILALLLLAPESDTSNETNLGFTLAEFVDRYNSTVDAHLYQDTTAKQLVEVKDMLKLDVDYFYQEDGDENFYSASNNGFLNYGVLMEDSGEKVQAVIFKFPNNITEEQLSMLLTFCKWFAEAVKPDMGEAYYTETLTKTIENGETREEGIAYFWEEEDGYYSYEIYYAA